MWLWGRLATIADRDQTKIADLIQMSIEQVLHVSASDREELDMRSRILQAIFSGWDDWTIAEQLEIEVARVAAYRISAGLEPRQPGQGIGRI